MRRPENSPGWPAQWPAVSTSFGAMIVPEQRNAGLPAMSMMMRTTAGWAFPSSVPSVMKDGRPGFLRSLGTRSQLSRLTQAAARTGMTRRAFMVPRGWDGGSDCNAERAPWPDCGDRVAAARRGHEASARRRRAGAVRRPRLESMMPDPVARGHHPPASFTGRTDGHVMTLTAMLTDTPVHGRAVALVLGREPRLGRTRIGQLPTAR